MGEYRGPGAQEAGEFQAGYPRHGNHGVLNFVSGGEFFRFTQAAGDGNAFAIAVFGRVVIQTQHGTVAENAVGGEVPNDAAGRFAGTEDHDGRAPPGSPAKDQTANPARRRSQGESKDPRQEKAAAGIGPAVFRHEHGRGQHQIDEGDAAKDAADVFHRAHAETRVKVLEGEYGDAEGGRERHDWLQRGDQRVYERPDPETEDNRESGGEDICHGEG